MELVHATQRQDGYFPSHTLRASAAETARVSPHPIFRLQKTIGNRAVQRLLKSWALQAKLAVSQPGDIYEQEADRVADLVISQALGPVQRKCACGGSGPDECEECQKNRDELSSASTPLKREDESGRNIEEAPAVVDQVLSSPGFPP